MALYNVALLPVHKKKEFISLAANFKKLADHYALGEQALPHVTLCHFEAEEEKLHSIWEAVKNILSDKVTLNFQKWSYTTFTNEIFWIALLPNERLELEILHQKVIDILNVTPKRLFDPHLTLINTKEGNALPEITKIFRDFTTIHDEFILSLGESDDIGQYLKVLFQHK